MLHVVGHRQGPHIDDPSVDACEERVYSSLRTVVITADENVPGYGSAEARQGSRAIRLEATDDPRPGKPTSDVLRRRAFRERDNFESTIPQAKRINDLDDNFAGKCFPEILQNRIDTIQWQSDEHELRHGCRLGIRGPSDPRGGHRFADARSRTDSPPRCA